MNTEILEDIGLTPAEIKAYLALIELGTSTAGPVIEKSDLQSSVVYRALPSLVEKGLASFAKKGRIRHYSATDPDYLVKFIDEKKKGLQSILPQLWDLQKPHEKQEVEVFEGFKGFKIMLYQLIDDAEKKDEYLFFSFHAKNPDDFNDIFEFYKDFEKERKRYGIVTKGIAPKNVKDKFSGRQQENLLFVDFPIPTNISVFKDKVAFTPWEDKQVSFLVYSRQLAESFREYFYSIWDTCKK